MSVQSFHKAGAAVVLGAIAFLLWVFYDVYMWMWGGV
jgi:hypothetical protein